MESKQTLAPSAAFIAASWVALFAGVIAYNVGLWNAAMELNEKGYYFTVLMFGLFSAISVQKSVRDQLEGIPVTNLYYGIAWFTTILSILLLTIGLWNAELTRSEKGFYAMSYTLSVFAAIAVQKNTRDAKASKDEDKNKNSKSNPVNYTTTAGDKQHF
ncbi:inner membrane protein YiaA [Paraflavitalea pollutisoli]|uniref:inner membrane protein YiaA n=1 Tax=Paraflavitalea pollutisoli TaxID=3034143 RepID=UPI0023EB0A54|nr:inner membrane protein YiaA [Paraflavitalea sp. H1-2-19X]